jgi:hypothetical protein
MDILFTKSYTHTYIVPTNKTCIVLYLAYIVMSSVRRREPLFLKALECLARLIFNELDHGLANLLITLPCCWCIIYSATLPC